MNAICVVSCIWQRPERLAYTLGQLDRQTHPAFDLALICNNPALAETAARGLARYSRPAVLVENDENRGPFARLEVMHALAGQYDFFVTVDDDLDFPTTLVADWARQADASAVQGWMGFRFRPGANYWARDAVAPGEPCDYLWGSNLCIPAAAVASDGILALEPDYWQCDDLWLCYHAREKCGLALRRAEMAVCIAEDGKDTYRGQFLTKVALLKELRGRGWQV
jgi:hypothetical protein